MDDVVDASSVDLESAEWVLDLLVSRGGDSYFGEPVTVLEHSLQAAHFARKANSPDELIVAALLHDVGHLLHRESESVADLGIDTRHEELAGRLLAAHLPPAATEPIRLHVAAKRYLCFADAAYRGSLSASSIVSLDLQGGPMSAEQADAFLSLPYVSDAILLRHWDDAAKVPSLPVPAIESYRTLIQALWRF